MSTEQSRWRMRTYSDKEHRPKRASISDQESISRQESISSTQKSDKEAAKEHRLQKRQEIQKQIQRLTYKLNYWSEQTLQLELMYLTVAQKKILTKWNENQKKLILQSIQLAHAEIKQLMKDERKQKQIQIQRKLKPKLEKIQEKQKEKEQEQKKQSSRGSKKNIFPSEGEE